MSVAEVLGRSSGSGYCSLLELDQVVLDAMPLAVYVCAADGRIVRYNRAAAAFWGRQPILNDPQERFCGSFRLYEPDGTPLPHAECPMATALSTGVGVHEGEVLIERLDGTRIIALVNIEPLIDADGRIEGAINCFQDISARKRDEARLRERERQFKQILDALPAAVYTTDAEGVVEYFNRAAVDLAGRTPRPGEDKWCVTWKLYWPDGSQMRLDECPMAMAIRARAPVRNRDVVAERPDGTRAPAMPFPTPLFDEHGEFVGAVNMLVDISELKRLETDARRHADEQSALHTFTERRYRADSVEEIYDAALDAIGRALHCERASILLFDSDGVMRFAAWRGLSADYRAAVEGHTPWQPGKRDPQPIFVADILDSDESDALQAIVTREGIRALAFVPIVADGVLIGKFMTYHDAPHAFEEREMAMATTLARQLGFGLEHQRGEEARRAAEAELLRSVERLNIATRAGKVGLWDWDVAADQITWTESLYESHGVERDAFKATFDDWLSYVHPLDRARVEQAIRGALEDDAPYDLELRWVTPEGRTVWFYASAVVLHEDGKAARMVGACVDITERKQADVERDLLVAELSHRVKNVLATVISISRQSLTGDLTVQQARRSFEGRIRAMAKTHTLLADAHWRGADLDTMLREELAPYAGDGEALNVDLCGPGLVLPPRAAVVVGMAIHELATNAAKYGAMSRRGGTVSVTWSTDAAGAGDMVRLTWRESGGPEVSPPTRRGFGRTLLEQVLVADLRGEVALDFVPTGLVCHMAFPRQDEPPSAGH